MVAFNTTCQPREKRVRITLHEARVLTTAVTISILQTPPPDCCMDTLDSLMSRIMAAFDLEVQIDEDTGDVIIDGHVVAQSADDDEEGGE